ncbi:TIGR02449 family protein [Parahaliea sp. F7430]|uniref:TIGR02449 family protein n=1 Tax=Sediminihaliea albiluteola TaxID=2758564 RepID=A0A7W2TX44_9GAMM|nr:TIGR02449 family protein [Sediminihaliea albiluteola]MBA6413531.1 TIGR02449 family protein [Sediminihaliea albiluteola]
MADNPLKALESKIDQLIALCSQLNQENQMLKAESSRWQRERQELIDKNELARNKVEAMIDRLRAME